MTTDHDNADRREREAEERIRETLTRIALERLNVETLETRNSDRLDFHQVSVWQIERALQAAFDAGRVHAMTLAKDEREREAGDHSGLGDIACPRCGETNHDQLVWTDDGVIDCQSCGTQFDPASL